MRNTNLHINSFRSIQLHLNAQDTSAYLGSATGFLCGFKDRIFLVTNWHVFSGRNFETETPIHSSAALPGSIHLALTVLAYQDKDSYTPARTLIENVPLYDAEANPLYKVHPSLGNDLDVSCLELTAVLNNFQEIKKSLFDCDAELVKLANLSVMDPVFIVGYPLKTSTTPNEYPIYKAATVASEPDAYEKPLFYVDGKTKKGMSGSPVIKKQSIKIDRSPNGIEIKEGRIDLVGVYSGRDSSSSEESEAELGIVWHFKECVLPILENYDS